MPYIITTKIPLEKREGFQWVPFDRTLSRRAVATLDEARHIAWQAAGCGDELRFDARAIDDALPEAGGTIGPLPDGTMIEVKRIGPIALQRLAHASPAWTLKQVIDAFNGARR